jgi:hypothetical protein
VRALQACHSLYRTLGDVIAWKLLRYDRRVILPLGQGTRVGRLSEGAGLDAELAELDYLWREQRIFAIHNDLTNCLRHGDLTAFEPRDDGTVLVTLQEVKAGTRTKQSQAERLKTVTELTNRGSHPTAAPDGGPVTLDLAPVEYATYSRQLVDLIGEARTKTYAFALIAPELLLEVYDESNPAGLDRAGFERRYAGRDAAVDWAAEERLVYSAASRRLRDRQQSFSPLAPLGLLPLALDDTVDILHGGLDFVTTLHAGKLEERFAKAGITARVARGNAAPDGFLIAERGDGRLSVPAYVREQVLTELMTLDTLVTTVDWMVENAARGLARPNVSIGYLNEGAVWETYPT